MVIILLAWLNILEKYWDASWPRLIHFDYISEQFQLLRGCLWRAQHGRWQVSLSLLLQTGLRKTKWSEQGSCIPSSICTAAEKEWGGTIRWMDTHNCWEQSTNIQHSIMEEVCIMKGILISVMCKIICRAQLSGSLLGANEACLVVLCACQCPALLSLWYMCWVSAYPTILPCWLASLFLLLLLQPLVLDKSTCPSPSMLPLVTGGEMHMNVMRSGREGWRKNVSQRKWENKRQSIREVAEDGSERSTRKEKWGGRIGVWSSCWWKTNYFLKYCHSSPLTIVRCWLPADFQMKASSSLCCQGDWLPARLWLSMLTVL